MTAARELICTASQVVETLTWALDNTVLTVIVIWLPGLPKGLAIGAEDILRICAIGPFPASRSGGG